MKCGCQHCTQHFEFDEADLGRDIECPSCGLKTMLIDQSSQGIPIRISSLESDKRILSAFLLCFFFGIFGAHAFYANRKIEGFLFIFAPALLFVGWVSHPPDIGYSSGTLYLSSIAALLIGGMLQIIMSIRWLVDFITIMAAKYEDGQGRKIKKWT